MDAFMKEDFLKESSSQRLSDILSLLKQSYDVYRYTVYRCATKIVSLQRAFYTSTIPYKLVLSILETNGLDKQVDERYPVQPFQLTKIIYEIYFAADKLGYFKNFPGFHLESAVSIMMTFLWRIFDPQRTHSIFLIEIKEVLLILCKVSSIQHLTSEMFALVCNQNRCISLPRLQLLLAIFIKFLVEIGEESAYGSHNIPEIMNQCHSLYPGVLGIDEYQFQCLWSGKQTRFLIYANLLALVKRMNDTEKLIHKTQCFGCHTERIIGIRFKCKKCSKLSLCMKCFSVGFSNKSHGRNHEMFEVFTEDPPSQPKSSYLIWKELCSLLCFKKSSNDSEDTAGICENQGNENEANTDHNEYISLVDMVQSGNKNDKHIQFDEPFIRQSGVTGSLKTLMNKLLDQNEKLENHISQMTSNSNKDFLILHQKFLKEITNQLSFLIDQTKNTSFPTSSTPRRTSFVNNIPEIDSSVADNLTKSIHGASINLSYLEANKSDYSTKDISTWYRNTDGTHTAAPAVAIDENIPDNTEMQSNIEHFRDLLHKVKDIIEDSYSDIVELTNATHTVENIVEKIIQEEESKRYFVIDV